MQLIQAICIPHKPSCFQCCIPAWEVNHGQVIVQYRQSSKLASLHWWFKSPLCTKTGQIERVHSFKLLGVYVDESLTWNCHTEYITSKASKRLYFLKVLKRSGLPNNSLMNFYTAAIRPILEYCSVVWGHNLSKKHSSQLETIQKRAIRIIHQVTRHTPYDNLLYYSNIASLQDRRSKQAKSFFTSILDQTSHLHHLLPQQRDDTVTSRLRSASKFPVPFVGQINSNHI